MEDMFVEEDFFKKKEDHGTPGEEVPALTLELEEWAQENSDKIISIPMSDFIGEENSFDFYHHDGLEIPKEAKPIRMFFKKLFSNF